MLIKGGPATPAVLQWGCEGGERYGDSGRRGQRSGVWVYGDIVWLSDYFYLTIKTSQQKILHESFHQFSAFWEVQLGKNNNIGFDLVLTLCRKEDVQLNKKNMFFHFKMLK